MIKKEKKKAISLTFTPKTLELAEKYAERFGYSSYSEAFANAMAFAYEEKFPPYVYEKAPTEAAIKRENSQKIDQMSNEEYATKILKAKLWAGKAWLRTPQGTDTPIPMADVKVLDKSGDVRIRQHRTIIAGTYVDIYGKTGEEMQQRVLQYWDDPRPLLQNVPYYNPPQIFADENGEWPQEAEQPEEAGDEDDEFTRMLNEKKQRMDSQMPEEVQIVPQVDDEKTGKMDAI